jgi:hypothetical protein
VQEVNSKLFSEPESVRISIADVALNSPEATNTDGDIDFLDGSGVGDESVPRIRLKIPPPDADQEEAPTESVSTADGIEAAATLGSVRIAIADSAANDAGSSTSLEASHRWKLHGSANHAATNPPQSIRIPLVNVAPRPCVSDNSQV